MNRNLIIVCLAALLFTTACGQRGKYVESDVIEVEFWGDIEPGDWIEIDGLKLVHAKNDTISGCDIEYFHDYTPLMRRIFLMITSFCQVANIMYV